MKRLRAGAIGLSVIAVLALMPAAQADPTVTVCAAASVTVNGESVVDEAHCVEV